MTYARSYASSRRSTRSNAFHRSHKRKIEKINFKRNAYRRNSRSWQLPWQGIRQFLVRSFYVFAATSVVAGISLLFVLSYHYLLTLPYFCIKDPASLKIEGQARSHPEQVLQAMQIRPGTSLLAIQPFKVEKALLQQRWIEKVELTRQWPDQLRIVVYEHQPYALVKIGKFYLINPQGILFKELEPEDPHDLPVITGLHFEHFNRVEGKIAPLLAKVFTFMESLQKENDSLNLASISEIHVDPERGLTIYPSGLGVGVSIGFQGHQQKLAGLQKVMPLLKQRGDWQKIEKIDLNYPQRVLVSLRNTEPQTP
ncbi:cell division protein FtsQ/DivIB [Desulfobacca acetoxidans]|nr:hypothetical protein [Desulfobacterales bacterium]